MDCRCDGALKGFFENGAIEKWLLRLKEMDEKGEEKKKECKIELINGSCADQKVDVIVNAANSRLLAGGGVCGVIFKKAGMTELTKACNQYKTPLISAGIFGGSLEHPVAESTKQCCRAYGYCTDEK